MAIFTNFTQDHLDYHGSMAAYWQAKAELFSWPGLRSAVINIDDSGNTTITKGLTEYKIAANGDVTTIIKSDPDTVLTTHKIGNDGRVTVTAPPGITFNGPFNVNGAMNLTGDLTQTGDTHQVGDLNQTGGIRSSDRHVAPLFDGPATSLIAGGAGASTTGVPSS